MINKELQKRILSSIILIPIAFFFIFQGPVFFAFFLSIFFLASSYEWIKMNKKDSFRLIGILYILFASYFIYLLNKDFFFQFILILIICIFTDIGGYIFGKVFKGPKLTKISPKKTYAGVVGGYFLSIIFANILNNFSDLFTPNYTLNGKEVFVLTLMISTVSQIGDIIISYFKRSSNIKDTGKLIPGHGGILDRIDGMIFAFPFFYIYVLLINL